MESQGQGHDPSSGPVGGAPQAVLSGADLREAEALSCAQLTEDWKEAYRDRDREAYLRGFQEPLRRVIRVDRKAALEASEESESLEDAIRGWREIAIPKSC